MPSLVSVSSVLMLLAASAAGGVPWGVGGTIGDQWSVERVQRHPEFVRLQLKRSAEEAAIEVTPGLPDDAWSTAHYRVQPPPGGTA